jgi:hypothetical protein
MKQILEYIQQLFSKTLIKKSKINLHYQKRFNSKHVN